MEKSLGDVPEGMWADRVTPKATDTEPIEALEDDEAIDEIIETLPSEDEQDEELPQAAAVEVRPKTEFQFAGSGATQEVADTTQVKNVEAVAFTRDRISQEIALMHQKLNEGVSVDDMRALLENDLEEVDALIEELEDDQQTVLRDEVARRDAILAKLAALRMVDAAEAAK